MLGQAASWKFNGMRAPAPAQREQQRFPLRLILPAGHPLEWAAWQGPVHAPAGLAGGLLAGPMSDTMRRAPRHP
jgi:hypothetical protein